jgi:hypothetical protein
VTANEEWSGLAGQGATTSAAGEKDSDGLVEITYTPGDTSCIPPTTTAPPAAAPVA